MTVVSPSSPQALRERALLDWGATAQRDLPWRSSRDPWTVLVSETMLQQTQVARVVPRFEAFMTAFPTASCCAASPVSEVIELWAGLGYNRRAVALHRSAMIIAEDHDGQVPDSIDGLLALPGVGPYTARAVLVFAHEADIGVVDTNVARIISRWTGTRPGPGEMQRRADELVPAGRGWAWSTALFDLGAHHCRARLPQCRQCPVVSWCEWGCEGPDPAAAATPQSRFEGSDRQGRGRLVDALRSGPVPLASLAQVMGWPQDPARALRVARSVVADGLAIEAPGKTALALP